MMADDKMDFICPSCERSFSSEQGLKVHIGRAKEIGVCPKKPYMRKTPKPDLSDAEIEELERRSDLNLLNFVDSDLSKLTRFQSRRLLRRGLIERKFEGERKGRRVFTERGCKTMEELGITPVTDVKKSQGVRRYKHWGWSYWALTVEERALMEEGLS